MNRITEIIIHHSASPRDATKFETINLWHEAKGWDGCGYHFVIEGDGQLRHGRPLPVQGAHAPPNNGRIGICITGDNTQPDERWSTEQLLRARMLVASLREIWPGLPVKGHRDVMKQGRTECPGVDIEELFNQRTGG